MGKIFISYRREESEGYAGRLFDGLKEHFGQENVFMDVTGIESGVDFVEALNNALGSCSVLISVIGKSWLSIVGASGNRRLDDPQDFIRLETKIALERGIKVIPILVQDAQMPQEKDLPDELKKLARRQAHKLRNDSWDYDIGRLFDILEKEIGLSPSVGSLPKETISEKSEATLSVETNQPGLSTKIILYAVSASVITIFSFIIYSQTRPTLQEPKQEPQVKTIQSPPNTLDTPSPITSHNKLDIKPSVAKKADMSLLIERKPASYSVMTSVDRATVIIVDSSGQEKDHISLDPDRVQEIYYAPDKRWSVVIFKTRNRPIYGALTVDLMTGTSKETLGIPSMPNAVIFDKQEVVMNFGDHETKRFKLQN